MTGDVQTSSGVAQGVGHVPGPERGAEGARRPRRRRPRRLWRVTVITAALAGVACLAAACSSPKSPAAGGSPTGRAANVAAKALAYSRCMRSHGIRDYPDPTIHGNSVGMSVGGSQNSDLNPSNPALQAARQACRHLQPGGVAGPPSATELAAEGKFAKCMRAHGFPTWPDPNGQGVFNVPGSIDIKSAQFSSTARTCQSQTNAHSLNITQGSPGGGS